MMGASLSQTGHEHEGARIGFGHSLGWSRVFSGARARILTWYVLLLAFSTVVSVLVIRQALLERVNQRVERSLTQEVEEFRQLLGGNNPATGQPFGKDVAAIFDVFLSRNIPDDDEFLLTLVDGHLYESSPRALPQPLQPGSSLINRWAQLKQPQKGEEVTSVGTIQYLAEPVRIQYLAEPIRLGGQVQGVFVVAHTTAGEREEVNEAVFVVMQVTLAVFLAASVLAWVVAGRVLAPLRLLTETARAIHDSDLTRRIPVRGSDEIAELSATFNEMLDRLAAVFASQRDFINEVGHELRTPITIIRGHLELLSDDPEEHRETLDLVSDELDRMNRFVEDILLLAKAERPDFLLLETVDLAALTEELYVKTKALAHREWRLDARGRGRVVADRQRLTQAVINLAQNATQHTQEGDVIALGSAIRKGQVCLWVRDTGEGIAPDDQTRIFERFARLASGRRRSEGAGLGLSIVRAIAEAHQGRVQLHSRPGAGSTFTVMFAVEPADGGASS